MDPGILIGEEDAARLAAMLNQFECGKLGAVETPPVIGGTSEQPNVAYAKVTSGTPSYSYYYPAKRVYRHLGDWVEAENIWLRGLNGETLENGKYYQARFFNMSPTLEPSAIYATQVMGSAVREATVIRAYYQAYPKIWVGTMMDVLLSSGWSTNYPGWIGAGYCYFLEVNTNNQQFDLSPTITQGKQYLGVFAQNYISGYPVYAVFIPPASGGTNTGMTTGGGLV